MELGDRDAHHRVAQRAEPRRLVRQPRAQDLDEQDVDEAVEDDGGRELWAESSRAISPIVPSSSSAPRSTTTSGSAVNGGVSYS